MISEDGIWIFCDTKGCDNQVKNHTWGRIKADMWYFKRDDTEARCPEHVPAWFVEWRKTRVRRD